MRQITLDIETTGLSTKEGDRIIEIGCVEIINRVITGNIFHTYCNPERPVGEVAAKITGIRDAFLADKPKFVEIVEDFFNFINGSDELIIHNASFDLEFINNELQLLNYPISDLYSHFTIVDTLILARTKHPGQRNNLDALAKRYNVSFNRDFHGALLDARILANLMLKMTAGQISLDFDSLNLNKSLIENNIEFSPKTLDQKNKEIENINLSININTTNKTNKSNYEKIASKSNQDLKIIYANHEELVDHEKYFNTTN